MCEINNPNLDKSMPNKVHRVFVNDVAIDIHKFIQFYIFIFLYIFLKNLAFMRLNTAFAAVSCYFRLLECISVVSASLPDKMRSNVPEADFKILTEFIDGKLLFLIQNAILLKELIFLYPIKAFILVYLLHVYSLLVVSYFPALCHRYEKPPMSVITIGYFNELIRPIPIYIRIPIHLVVAPVVVATIYSFKVARFIFDITVCTLRFFINITRPKRSRTPN